MIRKKPQIRLICLSLICFLAIIPRVSHAQVCACIPPGEPSLAHSGLQGVVQAAIEAAEQSIGRALDALKGAHNTHFTELTKRISLGAAGASTSISKAGDLIVKTHYKIGDAAHSKERDLEKDVIGEGLARDNMVTAYGCMRVTERSTKSESALLAKAAEEALIEQSIQRLNNTEGLTNIEAVARDYQYALRYVNLNMPNAPPGAGGGFVGGDKNFNAIFNEGTLSPEGLEMTKQALRHLNDPGTQKRALPSYGTQSGQAAYIAEERRKVRKIITDIFFAKMMADVMPTSSDGEAHTARRLRNEGVNPDQAVAQYIQADHLDQVSEAAKRKVQREGFLSAQTALDDIGNSQGGSSMARLEDLAIAIEAEYNGLLQDRMNNILLAIEYADMI